MIALDSRRLEGGLAQGGSPKPYAASRFAVAVLRSRQGDAILTVAIAWTRVNFIS
jgi:hypothetical protein